MTYQVRAGYANGTQLYYEVRGSGPSVLFIAGTSGDAGQFGQVADLLADDFTVVTYDRRGNSRAPTPRAGTRPPWTNRRNDAAGLLAALGLAPAAVYGNKRIDSSPEGKLDSYLYFVSIISPISIGFPIYTRASPA